MIFANWNGSSDLWSSFRMPSCVASPCFDATTRSKGVLGASYTHRSFDPTRTFLHQLHGRKIQIQPQAQLVAIQVVHGCDCVLRVIACPAKRFPYVGPVLLLDMRVVILLVRTPARELDVLSLAPSPQMPVDEFRSVVQQLPLRNLAGNLYWVRGLVLPAPLVADFRPPGI